jgi:glycosyltransferase involved in cell wall biosynthesis
MKRVLMVQPSMQPPGGGNGVAAWMLQALVRDHDVSLLTWKPVDFEEINRFFGTSLKRSDVRDTLSISPAIRATLDAVPLPLAMLKTSILLRKAAQMAQEFDLAVSANNEAEFSRPGIQYVHYPRGMFPRPEVDLRWYHHPRFFLSAYYKVCDRQSPINMPGAMQNLTLVNSEWVRGLVKKTHGISSQVVYPPVTATFADVPWADREDAFVCVGRIAPEKEIERIVAILERVRLKFPSVRLRVVGTPGLPRYYRRICAIAAKRSSWMTIHENLSREELARFLPRHRYGIHGMLEEHFGMAPAEMLRAGCIVFVPRGGGQVEIVDRDDRLCYQSVEGAADAICATMADPGRQAELRTALAARKDLYSAERFVSEIRRLVNEFPSPQPPSPA